MIVLRTLSLLALALLVIVGSARSQSFGVNSASGESEEDVLAREVDDPTAILTQLKLQDLYTPQEFPDDRADQHGPVAASSTGRGVLALSLQANHPADFRSTDSGHVARQFHHN